MSNIISYLREYYSQLILILNFSFEYNNSSIFDKDFILCINNIFTQIITFKLFV